MIFGTGTWFYNNNTVADSVLKIKKNGFSAVEIWMEHLLKTGEDPEKIKAIAKSEGMRLTLHATSYDLNITSINRGIRSESRKQMFDSVTAAAKAGAETVVVHPGRISSSKGNISEFRKELVSFLHELDRAANSEGVLIALEIMEKRAREILVLPEDANELMNNDWKNLKLTLDVAHARTVMDPVDFINQLKSEDIAHIHLSDSDSGHTHLPLGRGDTDIASILEALSRFYEGIIIIEGYVPGLGDSVLTDNYRYLLDNGWVMKNG